MVFDNPKSIKFDHHRWNTRITVVDESGVEYVFYASADSAIADSGLYFGSEEDYNEAMEGVW